MEASRKKLAGTCPNEKSAWVSAQLHRFSLTVDVLKTQIFGFRYRWAIVSRDTFKFQHHSFPAPSCPHEVMAPKQLQKRRNLWQVRAKTASLKRLAVQIISGIPSARSQELEVAIWLFDLALGSCMMPKSLTKTLDSIHASIFQTQ